MCRRWVAQVVSPSAQNHYDWGGGGGELGEGDSAYDAMDLVGDRRRIVDVGSVVSHEAKALCRNSVDRYISISHDSKSVL